MTLSSVVVSDHYYRIVYDIMLDQSRIGGYVLAKQEPVLLTCVEIDKSYRGKGYGKWLTEDAIRNARSIAKKIELLVMPNNIVAISLYKRCGFVVSKNHGYVIEMFRSLEE